MVYYIGFYFTQYDLRATLVNVHKQGLSQRTRWHLVSNVVQNKI